MKIQFDRTETYNIDGSPNGRREASKGDTRNLPKHLALSFIDMGAAHPVEHLPSQQKDFEVLESTEMLAREAVEEMDKFSSEEQVRDFIEGDDRVTVKRAAESKIEELNG